MMSRHALCSGYQAKLGLGLNGALSGNHFRIQTADLVVKAVDAALWRHFGRVRALRERDNRDGCVSRWRSRRRRDIVTGSNILEVSH
ncbi:hypothetical protein [Bradyrhizobium sp. B117]|uniref:hypothetical protein n=1 Tax=Bradyrhizobium sp. B117 TaxID=3140246 RepID=UPI003184141B